MTATTREELPTHRPETGVALVGLVLALAGAVARDSLGVSPIVTALGVGLLIAGTTSLAVAGSDRLRYSVAFVALLATPLLAFGGAVRMLGAVGVAVVLGGVAYSRLR